MIELEQYHQQFSKQLKILESINTQANETITNRLNAIHLETLNCLTICNTIRNCQSQDYAYELWGEIGSYIILCSQEVDQTLKLYGLK